jgi:hypothetical protein
LDVDYIVTGKKVKLKIYDGDHCQSWFNDAIKVEAGEPLELKSQKYVKNDQKESWSDVVKSFVMYTETSDEEGNDGNKIWNRDSSICEKDTVDCSKIAKQQKEQEKKEAAAK